MNMNKLITVYEWSNLYRFLWRYRPGHSVRKHFVISSIIASLLLLCMIIIVQPWGQVVKQILKYEIASLLFVIGLAEILMIGYAYDAHRFIV
jgi:FlaA1/EpsC-like NDP-sugar epimerase